MNKTPIDQISRIYKSRNEVKILKVAKFENGLWGTMSKRLNKQTLETSTITNLYTNHSMFEFISMVTEIQADLK